MHGAFAGAPKGNAHGRYKHGRFTCEAIARKRAVHLLIREANRLAGSL
jgi:hypothetical protein